MTNSENVWSKPVSELTPQQLETRRTYARNWYAANLEKARKQSRERKRVKVANWSSEQLEQHRASRRVANLNPQQVERQRAQNRNRGKQINEWRRKNRERVNAKARSYKAINNARLKAWVKANPEKQRAIRNAYRKKRCAIDPVFRIRINLSSRIWAAIKGRTKKAATTLNLLGCDIDWLKAWLEIQFKDGMNWENYGLLWEIDHIRPMASFDLLLPLQQKLSCHWTNLQPLYCWENKAKSDSLAA